MTGTDEPRYGPDTSPLAEGRYAGLETAERFLLYDTENAAAWIESDTVLGPGEVR